MMYSIEDVEKLIEKLINEEIEKLSEVSEKLNTHFLEIGISQPKEIENILNIETTTLKNFLSTVKINFIEDKLKQILNKI